MYVLSVTFSGNPKRYDYAYCEPTVPAQLRYLTGMDKRGPWYQTLTVVDRRVVEPEAVPAHVTKELVLQHGAVVAMDWHPPKPATKTATPPNNNYKHYLMYIGQLASKGPVKGWPAYQAAYSKLLKLEPYNPNIVYERRLK